MVTPAPRSASRAILCGRFRRRLQFKSVSEKLEDMKNVEGPDFQLTYPCFILLNGPAPRTILVQGEWCVCLFTDRDLVEQFHLHLRRDQPGGSSTVEVLEFSARDQLIDVLQACLRVLADDVTRVAVDATPDRQVRTARIGDFIGILQRQ